MQSPAFVRLRQHFDRPKLDDLPSAIGSSLAQLALASTIRPGQSVALTAGSRGIANIPVILRSVVEYLLSLGARPFLIPAMGSHGGGTAEGQRALLAGYGITEEAVGAPIRASMEVIELPRTEHGFPVYLDRLASEADHIGVIGRIKPHTSYDGPIESGLLKMMMIGLGKHQGALAYHKLLLEEPFDLVVRSVTRTIRQHARISFGLGIVENAYDETALIEAMLPREIESKEELLLKQAKAWMPRLPVGEAEVLIVDQIGKDISGSGMDTNVVGRKRAFKAAPHAGPKMRFIFVRGLSGKAMGNATGIGYADFTRRKVVQEMDYRATVINCLTAGYPEGANLPVHMDTDKEILEATLKILGSKQPHQARIIRILDTLHLDQIEVSAPCLGEIETRHEVIGSPFTVEFDQAGNLPPLARVL